MRFNQTAGLRRPLSTEFVIFTGTVQTDPRFLKNGRGDWRSFEPSPRLITPITTLFDGATEPFIVTVERLVRRSA